MVETPDDGRGYRARTRVSDFLRESAEKVGILEARARPLLGHGRDFALRQAREFQRRAKGLWLPEDPE